MPASGPLGPPTTQLPLLAQKPHSSLPVQPPQVVASVQGSAAVHSETSHLQSVQVPVSGPVLEPASHVLVSPQKPQGYSPVQLPQSECTQVGRGAQSRASHFQSVQLPLVGPVLEPAAQLPVSPQKPQPLRPTQPSQVVAVQVGGGGGVTVHSLSSQFQSVQLPVVGPVLEPTMQVSVSPQNPQG